MIVDTGSSDIGSMSVFIPNAPQSFRIADVRVPPFRRMSERMMWVARSRSPSIIPSSNPDDFIVSWVRNVSPATPHHFSVSSLPESRYRIVSISGVIRLPDTQISSAVFTTTVMSSGGMSLRSPFSSFGVPVPPESIIMVGIFFC